MAAEPSRGRVLAACLLSALAVNGWALHGASHVIGTESIGRRVGEPSRAVQVIARSLPAPVANRAVAPSKSLEPKPRTAPPSRPERPRSRIASPVPADADTGGPGYRFYEPGEVDVTAEPLTEWNLDPQALDALATSRIVFTIFVGSDGSVLHCRVDEPERLSPEQRKALAARLAETPMRPARLDGLPVPSRRRIELFTTGGI